MKEKLGTICFRPPFRYKQYHIVYNGITKTYDESVSYLDALTDVGFYREEYRNVTLELKKSNDPQEVDVLKNYIKPIHLNPAGTVEYDVYTVWIMFYDEEDYCHFRMKN